MIVTRKRADETAFRRGNGRLDKLLARPEVAAGVAELEAERRETEVGDDGRPGQAR